MTEQYRIAYGSTLAIHATCGMRAPFRNGRCVICALLGKVDPVPKMERKAKGRRGSSGE